MQSHTQTIPKNVVAVSILLAIFASTKIINLIMSVALPSSTGSFMTLMYGTVVVGLFVIGLFFQKNSLRTLSSTHIGICVLCIAWYIFSSLLVGQPSVSIQFFAIFTVAAFIIPGIIVIDVRIFLLAFLLFPSFGVFYFNQIIYNSILEEGILSMGICYSMLAPVLANLVYIRYYYWNERKTVKILLLPFTAINVYYLIQMSMFGSRGPLLCVLLLLTSFAIFDVKEDLIVYLRRGRTVLVVIGVLLIASSFVYILQLVNDFLLNHNLYVNAIDKILRLEDSGDISNGRDALSKIVWDGIWNSPFIGHGTSQFGKNTGIVYPHNFIYQMLYDGGVILTLCVLIPIIKGLIHRFKYIRKEDFVCLLLLFFASVPGALFSGDLWQSSLLWMFFGFVLSKNSIIKTD